MGKKHKKKHPRIDKKLGGVPIINAEKLDGVTTNSLKNNFIYLYVFFVFLTIMLFITYFIPSIGAFSYLISFYSTQNVIYFYIFSFCLVFVYLLFGYVVFLDKFVQKMTFYTILFSIFYTCVFGFVVVYITSDGYTKIINEPILWVAFFVVDLIIEAVPFYFGFKYFKERNVSKLIL